MKNLLKIFVVVSLILPARAFSITNGVEVKDDRYPSVVLVEFRYGICTGVVVGSNTVLTARHCFMGRDYTDLRVLNKQPLDVLFISHDQEPKLSADLALIKFESGLLPAPMPIVLDLDLSRDSDVKLVGYGDTNDPDWNKTDIILREGFNTLVKNQKFSGQLAIYASADEATKFDSSTRSLADSGDSGGPLLLERGIVGIASETNMGLNPDATEREFGMLTRYVDLRSDISRELFSLAKEKGFDLVFAGL